MHKIPPHFISSCRPSLLPKAITREQENKPEASKELAGTAIDISPSLNIGVVAPFSILGGIKLKEETMVPSHDFVAKSPLRQAITNVIAKEEGVSEVVWRESMGAIELGFGACASIPVAEFGCGLGISVDVGFEPSALLCYRYIRPARIYSGKEKDPSLEDHVVPFPLTAKDAESMPLGREVEICGTGKLITKEGFSITEGAGVMGIAKVGIGASFGVNHTRSGEYALSVMSLDGKKQVRVSIRKTNEGIREFGVDFRAGILNVCSIPLPSFGEGALPSLAHSGTSALIGAALGSYGSAVARISSGLSQKNDTICCYDLDLSKEGAQKAYQALLKLNPGMADVLLSKEDNGITKVTLRERGQRDYRTHNFKALNQQLYAKEKNNIARDGMLTKASGAQILYKDKIHSEKTDNWFTGKRELEWDGITVKDTKGRLHTYYRFAYERQHKVPKQDFVDHHFAFAKNLGINSVTKTDSTLIEMSTFNKLFSEADDVTVSMELFFTEEGVERIQVANAAMALTAFLRANDNAARDENEVIKANALLEHYQRLASERWVIFGKSDEMEEIINNYQASFKRNFDSDLELLGRAQEFSKFIARFDKANDSKNAREFFALLGNEAFDFKEVLGALTILAGRENIKVHNLCLKGGDVSIKSTDEGEIVHPREGIRLLPGSLFKNSNVTYFT